MSSPLPKRNVRPPLNLEDYRVERTSSGTFKLYKGAAIVGGVYYKMGAQCGWRSFVHSVGKRQGAYHETLEEAAGARWRPPIVALFTAAALGPVITLSRFLLAVKELTHVVECESKGRAFFEPIASFNCDFAAASYARQCKATNPENKYRVVSYGGIAELVER